MNSTDIAPTIGATFFNCRITIDDIRVNMQVWDTAGQERFRSMAPMYYRGANAALLVFELTNYNSFVEIKTWISELQRTVVDQIVLTLVGNKCDLPERAVSKEEVRRITASSFSVWKAEFAPISGHSLRQLNRRLLFRDVLADQSRIPLHREGVHSNCPRTHSSFGRSGSEAI